MSNYKLPHSKLWYIPQADKFVSRLHHGFMSILLFLFAVLVVVITAGGYYLYLNQGNKDSNIAKQTEVNTTEELDNELQKIELPDIDSDFKELDQDINSF